MMSRTTWAAIAAITCFCAAPICAQKETGKRLNESMEVLEAVMRVKENAIPQGLLDKAECVVIVPGVKEGAFIFGGKYGRGFLVCRKRGGVGWGGPGGVRVEGGSFGLQIGGSETDVIMLVMNRKGVEKLLKSRFTLGADASVAAGPVGRTVSAETDALMRAEILTWSRSRGVFAGVSLQGATLRQDLDVNKDLYGQEISNADIVAKGLAAPASASTLISLLNRYSSRKSS